MSDLIQTLKAVPASPAYGGYTGDRSAGVTDFPGFHELGREQREAVERVRKGEEPLALLTDGDDLVLIEHSPSGVASDYTDGKKWGYTVRRRAKAELGLGGAAAARSAGSARDVEGAVLRALEEHDEGRAGGGRGKAALVGAVVGLVLGLLGGALAGGSSPEAPSVDALKRAMGEATERAMGEATERAMGEATERALRDAEVATTTTIEELRGEVTGLSRSVKDLTTSVYSQTKRLKGELETLQEEIRNLKRSSGGSTQADGSSSSSADSQDSDSASGRWGGR